MSKAEKITVSDIKITSLRPNVPKEYEHLVPNVLIPQHMKFILGGVSNAVSNAIRRTVACELPVHALYCDYEDIKTNDPFVIPEMIQKRLRMIPIAQNVDPHAVFEIEVSNKSTDVLDVKTGQFKSKKALPFNHTHTLLSLNPGKYIKISNVRVITNYGFTPEYGMMVLAVNAVSISEDVEPLNTYEGTGVPSRLADPRVWRIEFNTNGSMEPKEIVKMACDNIITRLESLVDQLNTIENSDDQYVLNIYGESHTIGNLLDKTICDLFPDITAVTYAVSSVERMFTLRVRCDEDINTVMSTTIKYLVKTFQTIKSLF